MVQPRRPRTQQLPAVLADCQDGEKKPGEVTPQVKVPAETIQEEDNSTLAVAWRCLDAKLIASSKLTRTAKQTEEAVMLEWSQFRDFEGADQYSTGWAERGWTRRGKTADIAGS